MTQTTTRPASSRVDGRESAAPATAGELLELVRTGRASTRSQLRALTGLSRTAITTRVSSLTSAGLLLLGEELASTGGRPPGALVFNQHAGVVLAVAIGRSRSQLAVLDLDGEEISSDSRDHEVGVGPDELMPQIAGRLAGLLDDARSEFGELPVLGVGLSLPGTLDPTRGVSIGSPDVSGWDGVELAPYLAGVTTAPLFAGNDADVLARSELLGRSANLRDVLVVKASTGLGLGIIADGRVLSGHLGAAGEIGHVVVDPSGDRCACGRSGCLETILAVPHLRRRLAGHDPVEVLTRVGEQLGAALAPVVGTLNLHEPVLSGPQELPDGPLREAADRSIRERTMPVSSAGLVVRTSELGEDVVLVGAAVLVLAGQLGVS